MTLPKHLVHRYSYHPPETEDRIRRHEAVREASMQLAVIYEELLPSSREASLAHTALQEASMWANAAVALHEPLYTDTSNVSSESSVQMGTHSSKE